MQVYRVPIDQTDGDRPSREGLYPDPGEYRGGPQLLHRATLLPTGNAVYFFVIEDFVLYLFGRFFNIGVPALYRLTGSTMP